MTGAQRFEATATLALALERCTPQSCSSYRRPQLEALLTVLKEIGSPAADSSLLLAKRLDGLGQLGPLPESELRLNWAIAPACCACRPTAAWRWTCCWRRSARCCWART